MSWSGCWKENRSIGAATRRLADNAAHQDALLVSAITFTQVAILTQWGRLTLTLPVANWRRNVLELGVSEVPVSGDIGILSTELEGFPTGPADRIIAATALTTSATLVTADEKVLNWSGLMPRQDARN